MFRLSQNLVNLSETKLLPMSDIMFLDKPYSETIILHASIRLSADRSAVFLMTGEHAVIISNVNVVSVV